MLFNLQQEGIDLTVDFTRQQIDKDNLHQLLQTAKKYNLVDKIKDLFAGNYLNITENKKVWHTVLRDYDPPEAIFTSLDRINHFIDRLYTNNNIKNILCLGIGGSYLGPKLCCNALDLYTYETAKDFNFYFIANIDNNTLNSTLSKLKPEETLVIISSKSFTTAETIYNAKIVEAWLNNKDNIVAVTANSSKALEFGINQENIFIFWDFVGGRYSIWSAVGLPVAIKIGFKNFNKLLSGAYQLDQHFSTTEQLSKNIPVLMALIGIFNINIKHYRSLAIMPYLDALADLPDYLQQLEMESNGKTIDLQGNLVDYDTAPIIWGGVGCNGQHSYMQMLHQGSQVVPVDFIVETSNNKLLLANCLAQSKALAKGTRDAKDLESFEYCIGNKPSTIISFNKLTPEVLGALLALYEHKVFVQGIMWNINSFDQWGVAVGKNLVNSV